MAAKPRTEMTPEELAKQEEQEFNTGPLSVLTQSVKNNTQVSEDAPYPSPEDGDWIELTNLLYLSVLFSGPGLDQLPKQQKAFGPSQGF